MKCISVWLRSFAVMAVIGFFAGGAAQAHKGSDAFLDVTMASAADQSWRFKLSVAVKDFDIVVPLDGNLDGKVTWGETKAAMPAVLQWLNNTVSLVELPMKASTANSPVDSMCRLNWQFQGVERRSDGTYLQLAATAQCDSTHGLGLVYTLFREQDANHRLMLAGRLNGRDLLATLSPQQASPFPLRSAGSASPEKGRLDDAGQSAIAPMDNAWKVAWSYFLLGARHLLEGYDHLAFLLALVLPLQLTLGSRQWRNRSLVIGNPLSDMRAIAVNRPSNTWLELVRTITAFTVGHSITLIAASLGWTVGSPGWAEPVIALSIGVTAMLNLYPVKSLRVEVLAVLFGLVHGYGFAGLLQEAAAPEGLLPYALAGFNLGIEAGQLIAVCVWVAVSQVVVMRPWYQTLVVRRGSQLLTVLAVWWFWQRVA